MATLYSRSLFLPGPLPPATHLGVTLERHCVVSGLRYTLYHLGFRVPEKAPVRILQLRLYLDAAALAECLAGTPGAAEIVGALTEPRGEQPVAEHAGEVAAASLFHHFRLAVLRRRRLPTIAEPADGATAWKLFRAGVSRWLVRLNDAFLTDTLAARNRRRRRSEGRSVSATLPRQAWAFRAAGSCRLDCLGAPDLAAPSWSEDRTARDEARAMLAEEPLPPRDGRRGIFRETFRDMLSHLRPAFLALAETARERGVLDEPDDAFFVPFDLAGDLAAADRPAWLDEAVESNRREYESIRAADCPADELAAAPTIVLGGDREPERAWNCLLPIS